MAKDGNSGGQSGGGVDIAVRVVGADAAQQQMQQLAAAARAAEQQAAQAAPTPAPTAAQPEHAAAKVEHAIEEAADKAAVAKKRLGDETRRAGDELFDFEKKGEKVVKGFLGVVSPELAQAADFMIDLAEGATKVTGALLAVAGVGAALGVITLVMSQWEEKMARVNELMARSLDAMRQFREQGASAQAEAGEAARRAGVVGAGGDIVQMMARLGGAGVPREMAMNAGIAQAIAATNGLPFDERVYLRGLVGSSELPQFGADGKLNATNIAAVMKAGQRPGAEADLDAYMRDVAAKARAEAPGPEGIDQRGIAVESALQRLGKQFPQLGADELRILQRLLASSDRNSNEAIRAAFEPVMPDGWLWGTTPWNAKTWGDVNGRRPDARPFNLAEFQPLRERLPTGSKMTAGELIDIAQNANVEFSDTASGAPRGVNLTIINNTTNVAQQHNGTRGPIGKDTYEDAGN